MMHHGEAILGFLEASPYSRMKKLPVAWVCCPGEAVNAVIGYISQIDFSHCLLKLGDLGPVFHHRQVSCVIRAKVLLLPSIATNPPTHHGQVLEEVLSPTCRSTCQSHLRTVFFAIPPLSSTQGKFNFVDVVRKWRMRILAKIHLR